MTSTGDFTQTRTLDVAPEAIVEGSTFADRYAIERRLGAGAQSTVYSALDMLVSPPRRVALKVARTNETSLSREAELLARVHCDGNVAGVVRLVEPGLCDFGCFKYLVLDYIDGPTLRNTNVTVEQVCRLGGQIARTLALMHQINIVFADVKPDNIVLRDGIEPVLVDLGAAREMHDSHVPRLLTPAYASPEQLAGQEPTAASDVYALAIVLEEWAGARAPKQLHSILARAKATDPAERPSAWALAQSLDEMRFGPSKHRPSRLVLGLIVMVLGLAGIALWTRRESPVVSTKRPEKPILTQISASGGVQYLALGDPHIYWSDGNGRSVFRAPLHGGPPETVTKLDAPAHQIAVSGQWLFVRSPGDIWVFANGKLERFATSTGRGGIVADDRNVVWTNEDTGEVVLANVRGDAPLRVLASGQARPYSVAMDATHVVWANEGNGTLARVPRQGGETEVIVQGQSWPAGTALDGTHVYWADRAAGVLMRAPKSGGEPQFLTNVSVGSYSTALSGTHLYWTSTEDGRIMRVLKTGGVAEGLVMGQQHPYDIVVRENVVFFANDGVQGGVMRLDLR